MQEELRPGTTIDDRYHIEAALGTGGMGEVYVAWEEALGRKLALKFLHVRLATDLESVTRFQQEARVLSSLKHVNLVQVFRYGLWQDSQPYIAMELLTGQSLRQLLDSGPRLDWRQAVRIAVDVAICMNYVHDSGIVHRDLKPENIFLQNEANHEIIKILDFGLCKLIPEQFAEAQKLTQTGALVGTAHYMAPELVLGRDLDRRSDIYSLGCILYQMLAGKPPHDAENPIGLAHRHAYAVPSKLSAASASDDVPCRLEEVVLKCLMKDPSLRYQDMAILAGDLQEILQATTGEHQLGAAQTLGHSRQARRRRKYALIALATTLLAFAAAFFSLTDPGWVAPYLQLTNKPQGARWYKERLTLAERLTAEHRPKAALLAYEGCLRHLPKELLLQAALFAQFAEFQLSVGNAAEAETAALRSCQAISDWYGKYISSSMNPPEGEIAEGKNILQRLIPLLTRFRKVGSPVQAFSVSRLLSSVDRSLARNHLKLWLEVTEQIHGPQHGEVGRIYLYLAELECGAKNYDLALRYATQSSSCMQASTWSKIEARIYRAELLRMAGRPREAIAECNSLLEPRESKNLSALKLFRIHDCWANAKLDLGEAAAAANCFSSMVNLSQLVADDSSYSSYRGLCKQKIEQLNRRLAEHRAQALKLIETKRLEEERRKTESKNRAQKLYNEAISCFGVDDWKKAQSQLKEGIKLLEQAGEGSSYLMACSLHYLAYCYHRDGRFAEAEKASARSLEIKEQQRIDTAEMRSNLQLLAKIYLDQKKFLQAERKYKEALAVDKRHPTTKVARALVYHGVGLSVEPQRRLEEAEKAYRQALALVNGVENAEKYKADFSESLKRNLELQKKATHVHSIEPSL